MNIEQARDELRKLEPFFHTPATYPTPELVEAILSSDFREVGASGRGYSREDVVRVLAERTSAGVFEVMEALQFACSEVADGCYLVTYLLQQKDRLTRRSSLWRCTGGTWMLLYHQGTIVG
jgi:hypothetical protein